MIYRQREDLEAGKMLSKYLLMTLMSSVFWAVFIIQSNINVESCILEEKVALFDFKASLNETKRPDLLLPSWINIHHHHRGRHHDHLGQDDDCCNWGWVTCSNITGRIVQLQPGTLLVEDLIPYRFLNFTALLPLKNLQTLDLRWDGLRIDRLDCEGMTNLKSLQSLILDHNFLRDDILHCISPISSLKRLSLAWNELVGSFPLQELSLLKQLQHLDLSHNKISDALFLQGICSLKNLIGLYLEFNNLNGSIPICLSNLTSLKALDMGGNDFSGSIPPCLITRLIQLEYLSLYSSRFEGSFSLSHFSNHSKLQVLAIGPFNDGLYVDLESLAIPPPFQLRVLILAGCIFNNKTRHIPTFLMNQKELRILDLSSNNLVGEIPNWLLKNNTHLKVVVLRNNLLTGPFLPSKLQDLQVLDISNNEIGSEVPWNIGFLFSNLTYLNLSRNYFQGSIPESLGYLETVLTIDLSHNNFSGEMPDRIGTGCAFLHSLYLSNNNLRGYFPSSLMNLNNLEVLFMDNNRFAGIILGELSSPLGLGLPLGLELLDMSNNEFEGEIPSWIGNLSSLEILDISQNQLKGTIPYDICKLTSLVFLDLSENQLHGSLPACHSLNSLRFIHLQVNQITGSIPNGLLNSRNLTTIDFRHNYLSGNFPHDITTLENLRVLLLGGNNFQGHIPRYICQLRNLRLLDFSQNKFSGQIPSCQNYISFGVNPKDSSVLREDYEWAFSINTSLWELEWTETTFSGLYVMSSNDTSFYSLLGEYTSEYLLYAYRMDVREKVEFTTKGRVNPYEGNILNYMSGLNLSCNQLTGEIPSDLGDLSEIRALNLSHNYLQGSIPSKLSMLSNIESLDLSYNNFSGQIPYELTNLHFLSIFNVSYNNLSGRTPKNGQFANFDEDNYRGNPNLCGPLLSRHCDTNTADILHPVGGVKEENDDNWLDMVDFFWSFSVSFVTTIGTLTLTLYVSPYYRRVLSYFIDKWILSRFYRRYKRSLR